MNRIPGSRLLISNLPGSALRTYVESLGKPRDVNKHSQRKPCLVNLISKDTHLVFSIYILFWPKRTSHHITVVKIQMDLYFK